MDWKLELVAVPVADVDRAKAFYTEQAGFNADHDHTVSDVSHHPEVVRDEDHSGVGLVAQLTQLLEDLGLDLDHLEETASPSISIPSLAETDHPADAPPTSRNSPRSPMSATTIFFCQPH